MKVLITIFISILFVSTFFAQQDLLPAFTREISYQGDIAYFNGSPFTGLLVEEKTNRRLGEFRNGYKNGMFTEYYANGKKKSECKYVNGLENGVYTEWYENKQLKSSYSYNNGNIVDGKYLTYFENGQKKTETTYKNGQMILYGEFGDGKFIQMNEKIINKQKRDTESNITEAIGIEDKQNEDPSFDAFVPYEKGPEMVVVGKPDYPEIAKRAGITGKVYVKVLVDKTGKPKRAVIVKSDSELFNQAAIDAAMKSVFTPAIGNNKPIGVWIVLPYKFQLNEGN